MDFTKGLPCPCCNEQARFQGGSFGGLMTTTNIKCGCGFSAWVIVTKDDYYYEASAEPKDKIKANPYLNRGTDKKSLIIQKHYFKEAIEACEGNNDILSSLRKALSFLNEAIEK